MESENEKEIKDRFLSCGDNTINIGAIHRIEILWKENRYWVSVKCIYGSTIRISKKYPSYEAALALYQKILDTLRSDSDLELIEVSEDE